MVEGSRYVCRTAALWLPPTLALGIFLAAAVAVFGVDPDGLFRGSQVAKQGVIILGGLIAWWAYRKGAELRIAVQVTATALEFTYGKKRTRLPLEHVNGLAFHTPFAATRNWLPAAIVIDDDGGTWRLSALLEDGDRLIVEILERTRRNDLLAWAETLGLDRRMGRAGRWIGAGYLLSLALPAAAMLLFLT